MQGQYFNWIIKIEEIAGAYFSNLIKLPFDAEAVERILKII